MDITIRRLKTEQEKKKAAELLKDSEPWITLRRTYDQCMETMHDPAKERFGVFSGREQIGVVVIDMNGWLKGYIQAVCIEKQWQGKGIGSKIMEFAETYIFRYAKNVFICYSSFNPRAGKLYDRLGYEKVGTLHDYIVEGHDEILMRKTIGPIAPAHCLFQADTLP
ncbi:hypothetical protein CE91St36_00250 [Christensenellaceae bacterium]|nr:hypothetical protein CE91St36_00250 [Christensenellaceae bacterium]BDF59875.1 hypothetical protein CE91St37_00250 [Christensenellaceae bacterium]